MFRRTQAHKTYARKFHILILHSALGHAARTSSWHTSCRAGQISRRSFIPHDFQVNPGRFSCQDFIGQLEQNNFLSHRSVICLLQMVIRITAYFISLRQIVEALMCQNPLSTIVDADSLNVQTFASCQM